MFNFNERVFVSISGEQCRNDYTFLLSFSMLIASCHLHGADKRSKVHLKSGICVQNQVRSTHSVAQA